MSKVITFGECLLRFSNKVGVSLDQTDAFQVCTGGSEINVAVNLAKLGIDSRVLTCLPDNPIGQRVERELKSNHVDTSSIHYVKDSRLGFYYYLRENALMNPTVIYDRKQSAFTKIHKDTFDFKAIFNGAQFFVVSGITLAVAPQMVEIVEDALKVAQTMGMVVIFDFNYRSKLWNYEQAKDTYQKVLPYVDVCVATARDLTDILEYEQTADETKLYHTFMKQFDINTLAHTKRELVSSTKNTLTGYLYTLEKTVQSSSYTFDITDRVGAGDAFTSGLIYQLVHEGSLQEVVEFATSSAVLKHGVTGDFNLITKDEITEFIKGNQDINR